MFYLNESQTRLYVASEAKALGCGGKRLIEKELGLSHNTINKGIASEVFHFPFGTSKWNKIEHRLFSFISKNWRGKSLVTY